jgi:transposase
LVCIDENTAVGVELTPGQAGDAPQFEPLFEAARERVPDAEEVVADRAYDSWDIKEQTLDADVAPHIPSKSNAVEPWPYEPAVYAERNRIERLINKMKQFRAVATRFDKLKESFLAVIKFVLCFIKLRSFVNRT